MAFGAGGKSEQGWRSGGRAQRARSSTRTVRRLLFACAVLASLGGSSAVGLAAGLAPSIAGLSQPRADSLDVPISGDARRVEEWVLRSGDNHRSPFMIVDKANARMFIFAPNGALMGDAPVLLGLARGDDSPPGIGNQPLASIRPADRITPAGRFEAAFGRNLAGQDILWVDYLAAISVHRASDLKPGLSVASRLARLASATPADNRISHGCINVSDAVFDHMIRPAFAGGSGVVYVLPETRSVHDEFPAV